MNPTFRLKGSSHTFTPLGGPIDTDPTNNLFASLGHAIAAQGRFEYLITALVIHVNKPSASEALHDPNPSDQHRRMLKLLRKWLSKHPDYSKHKMFDDDVFYQGLVEQAKLRNDLAHGLIESIDADAGQFVMRHIKRVGEDTWSPTTKTYSFKVPSVLAEFASLAARHFVEVAKVIFEQPETP